MDPVLTAENAGFRYGNFWALRGVDLALGAGEILGVLGPNGSGKSTLLKLMAGVLRPHEGRLMINGRSMTGLRRSQVAKAVAFVPQETHFRFAFSALEVVLMGRFPHLGMLQFEREQDMAMARDAMSVTHCLDLAGRSIHELSGGEKQRVLIARALAQEPGIILLDEPTSFLDLNYKWETYKLITSLSLEQGKSVVVVSHDIDLAAQYCHRLVMLRAGGVYDEGEPQAVITASNIRAVYGCPVLVDQNPATGRPRVNLTP